MKKNEIVLYKDSTSTVRAFEPNSDNQVMIVWFTGVMNSDNYLEIGRVFLGGYFEPYYDYRSRKTD